MGSSLLTVCVGSATPPIYHVGRPASDLLDIARSTGSTWFVNFTSASHSPPTLHAYPWNIASGSWGVHALLARYIVDDPLFVGRLGTILMDYPEEAGDKMLPSLLIAMNEQL